MADEVDALHGHNITYLGEVSKSKLEDESTGELLSLMTVVNDLEAIGDIIETNLVSLGLVRLDCFAHRMARSAVPTRDQARV